MLGLVPVDGGTITWDGRPVEDPGSIMVPDRVAYASQLPSWSPRRCLLVVDDLSSALDVRTEQLLWDRIGDAARDGTGPGTLLVVSHRQAALRRADQIIVLDRGRVAGRGRLDDLLRTCPEMRRLWTGKLLEDAEESP